MNKFKQFYKFCKCYQTQLVGEQLLKQIGFELNEGPFLNNIDYLQIDTEGFDYEVLKQIEKQDRSQGYHQGCKESRFF